MLLNKRRMGRYPYVAGGNEEVAKTLGINVGWISGDDLGFVYRLRVADCRRRINYSSYYGRAVSIKFKE